MRRAFLLEAASLRSTWTVQECSRRQLSSKIRSKSSASGRRAKGVIRTPVETNGHPQESGEESTGFQDPGREGAHSRTPRSRKPGSVLLRKPAEETHVARTEEGTALQVTEGTQGEQHAVQGAGSKRLTWALGPRWSRAQRKRQRGHSL